MSGKSEPVQGDSSSVPTFTPREVTALGLGPPPKGRGSWSLRLLAQQAVDLRIVDSISCETVNCIPRRLDNRAQDRGWGDPSERGCPGLQILLMNRIRRNTIQRAVSSEG